MKKKRSICVTHSVVSTISMIGIILAPLLTAAAASPAANHITSLGTKNEVAALLGWEDRKDAPNLCHGTYRTPEYVSSYPVINEHAPVKITADGPEFLKLQGVSELKDNVVVEQPGRMIHADRVFIFRDNQTHQVTHITLQGHVRIYQKGSVIISERTQLTLYPQSILFENAAYRCNRMAWGTATMGRQNAKNVTTLNHASYSTCAPNRPSWQIVAKQIVLDKPHNVGKAYQTLFKIHNIPVFYSPYYSFQLNSARKSGFLVPLYGHTSDVGSYFGLPFYINLAPNYDMILTPKYYGDRGFKMDTSFRYMDSIHHGDISASILPNDSFFETFRNNALITYSNAALYPSSTYQPYLDALQNYNNLRGMFTAEDHSTFTPHWRSRYYINLVSDSYYLADITAGNAINNPLANQLLNLLQLDYANNSWDFSTYVEQYQTLHLITQIQDQGQALDQYASLPALDAHGYFTLSPQIDTEFNSDYNHFTYSSTIDPNKPTGDRFHIRPGLSWMLEKSASYLKSQVWLDSLAYSLDYTTPGISTTSSRTLPIIDLDTGMHFLRQFQFNQESYQQTLEPRLFYLYVPYENQDNLPNFDTVELPFFFDQLFSLNNFQGVDRLENANQLSFGITSTIHSMNKGRKLFSFDLGSIYYFSQPNICLTADCNISERNFSPIITDFSFYPMPAFSVSSSYAWDPATTSTNNAAFTLSYHRDGEHILYLSYVYVASNDGTLPTFSNPDSEATDYANTSSHLVGSATWPLTEQWNILGHSDYNLALNRIDTIYGGLEYNSCCWAIRFVVKELFDTSTVNNTGGLQNNYETSYFIQINLKGLATFGSGASPIKATIPGYKA